MSAEFNHTKIQSRKLETTALILILFLAAYLRLTNLETNPHWFTDEATHLDIARNLLNGEMRYLAVQDSWLLFSRLPLFEVSLAALMHLFGMSMMTLRAFTAALGILTVGLVYGVLRYSTGDKWLALIAAGLFAVFPQAVLYSRFGFSYNLLPPLIMLALLGFFQYRKSHAKRWLILAAISIGLGTISDVLMWSFVPLLLMIVVFSRPSHIMFGMMVAMLPLALYALIMLYIVPEAFLFDLNYVLSRVGGGSFQQQLRTLSVNLSVLMRDGWWLAGVIGLFFLPNRDLKAVCFLLLLPLIVVGRAVALYNLSAYYTIPFLPLIAIGLAGLLRYGLPVLWHLSVLPERANQLLVVMILCATILWIGDSTFQRVRQVQTLITTEIESFLIVPEDARAVADFVNGRTTSDSIVIASAPIAWLLKSNAADFQMAAVFSGEDAVHIPSTLPQDRLVFVPDYQQAQFVVVDDLWRNWGVVHIPAVAQIYNELAGWDVVFEAGSIGVYANPQASQ